MQTGEEAQKRMLIEQNTTFDSKDDMSPKASEANLENLSEKQKEVVKSPVKTENQYSSII